jgi:hypothetical protein
MFFSSFYYIRLQYMVNDVGQVMSVVFMKITSYEEFEDTTNNVIIIKRKVHLPQV